MRPPGRACLLVASLLAVSLAMGPLVEAEGVRTVSKTYVAATFVPPETDCSYNGYRLGPFASPQAAYQQACFALMPGEETFSLVVDDPGPLRVQGWYVFLDDQDQSMDTVVLFCDAAAGTIPEGARTLFVVLWGFNVGCARAGVTTAGTLTGSFQ